SAHLPPRPPPSPLFPYTTLFRSKRLLNEVSLLNPVVVRVLLDQRLCGLRDVGGDLSLVGHFYKNVEPVETTVKWLRTGRLSSRKDRKSTRLNSSHVKISYAVFCL